MDARERMHDARHRLIVDRVGREVPRDTVELVQRLSEPKLMRQWTMMNNSSSCTGGPCFALRSLQGQPSCR